MLVIILFNFMLKSPAIEKFEGLMNECMSYISQKTFVFQPVTIFRFAKC